jgi:SNF2 family DNA or RNA helicase
MTSQNGSDDLPQLKLTTVGRHAFPQLRPGVPKSNVLSRWSLGAAERHTIGWFDLEAHGGEQDQNEDENDGDGATAAPLSPMADLMRRLAAILQPPPTSLYTPNGFLEWPAPLLPYQREGVAALVGRTRVLLADDMGLGKTIQAIAALRILFHQQKIASALVVCPASLLAQWHHELTKWAADLKTVPVSGSPATRGTLWQLPAHVRLVGYETLRADVLDLAPSPVLRGCWDVLVLDEASRIKNRDSGIAQACRRVPTDRRWALTGTPLENRIEDVASILEFLEEIPASNAPADVASTLRRVQLRRRKEDVLGDLPPRTEIEVTLELPPGQRAAYDEAEREGVYRLRHAQEQLTITHVLELISRLKQICNFDPATGESAKLADIAQRMRSLSASGHRALVFSQFVDENFGVGKAAEWLKEYRPLLYTGALSQKRRSEVITEFKENAAHKTLILSLRAGGLGLNLQAASYIFHLDRWWNPAIEAQADARAHRLGQPYPVMVYKYTCLNTIEERIDSLLKSKRRLFAEVVNDVSLDVSKSLSEQELFGLFGLRAQARQRAK